MDSLNLKVPNRVTPFNLNGLVIFSCPKYQYHTSRTVLIIKQHLSNAKIHNSECRVTRG